MFLQGAFGRFGVPVQHYLVIAPNRPVQDFGDERFFFEPRPFVFKAVLQHFKAYHLYGESFVLGFDVLALLFCNLGVGVTLRLLSVYRALFN